MDVFPPLQRLSVKPSGDPFQRRREDSQLVTFLEESLPLVEHLFPLPINQQRLAKSDIIRKLLEHVGFPLARLFSTSSGPPRAASLVFPFYAFSSKSTSACEARQRQFVQQVGHKVLHQESKYK